MMDCLPCRDIGISVLKLKEMQDFSRENSLFIRMYLYVSYIADGT